MSFEQRMMPLLLAALIGVVTVENAAAADWPPPEKLPSHPDLPDPLVMFNGERVSDKEQWLTRRRPELMQLFQHYMYGYLPAPLQIESKIERRDRAALGGKATLKEVTIRFGPFGTPPIHLLLVVPNRRDKPAPVFLGTNFSGNHAVIGEPRIRLPAVWIYPDRKGVKDNRATEAGRGTESNVWVIDQSIDRGYAVATFYCGDVDPDRPDARDGIQPFLARLGLTKPGPHDWGTIAAWAWGMQRAVDYLVTDKDIDSKRIVAVGHSRLGKAALLAAAFDERIALAIPHQAGCGGTAPSRTTNPKAETVKKINDQFPHWFNGAFKEFNDRADRLPFDQHCLAALMAPRPLLYTNALEDQWADPAGQFPMLQAADPAYRLFGVVGLKAKEMPELGKLVDSRLGYWIRAGKHSMRRADWKLFLDFADKHLGGKPSTSD
jgi:hypothetical protein